MNDEEKFFTLLKYSNKLKKNKKYLDKEDPDSFDNLLNFLVRIAENFHYSEKQEYINLAKCFLDDKITANEFSYAFIGIYDGIGKELDKMKIEESAELANFLNKTDQCGLNQLLAQIYGSCDSFSPDPEISMSDEKELKDYARILVLKLEEE